MPELPEIEHLRRTLELLIVGRRVARVSVHRRDVVRVEGGGAASMRAVRASLLRGCRVAELRRRGKHLAIIADGGGPVLLVHLGMSGQLLFLPHGRAAPRCDHVHVTWHFGGQGGGRLIFRDPRRFGRLTPFNTAASLEEFWDQRLGPDALSLATHDLAEALAATRRCVKCVLLDQGIAAGIGNIYADESLHRARIHPMTPASALARSEVQHLAAAIRATLAAATLAGGTTLRDYRDAAGRNGGNRENLLVYGRTGKPCRSCGATLVHSRIAQRTSTYCPFCQLLGCPPTMHNVSDQEKRSSAGPPTGSRALCDKGCVGLLSLHSGNEERIRIHHR